MGEHNKQQPPTLSGGEHQRPAPAPQPGRPHPQANSEVHQAWGRHKKFVEYYGATAAKLAGEGFRETMEKLANDLNGEFDRDEVELGLPKREKSSISVARLAIGKKLADEMGTTITGRAKSDSNWSVLNLAMHASDIGNLARTKAALEEQVLQERMAAMYPEPRVEVLPAFPPMTTKEFAARLQQVMSGDTKDNAVAENRCIKPPFGCGKPLYEGSPNGVDPHFRDSASQREYHITGMCQACQDKFEAAARANEEAECEGHPSLGDVTEYCDGSCCG